jgi:hypothetical protein
MSAVREIASTYQVGIDGRELEAYGVPPGGVTIAAQPVSLVGRPLFNPAGNYSYYILIGLVCAAAQSVIRMAVGVSIGFGSYDQICRDLKSTRVSTPRLFACKLIGACAIALPATYGAVAAVLTIFGTPHRGSLLLIFFAVTMYVVVQVCMGYGYFGLC